MLDLKLLGLIQQQKNIKYVIIAPLPTPLCACHWQQSTHASSTHTYTNTHTICSHARTQYNIHAACELAHMATGATCPPRATLYILKPPLLRANQVLDNIYVRTDRPGRRTLCASTHTHTQHRRLGGCLGGVRRWVRLSSRVPSAMFCIVFYAVAVACGMCASSHAF